MNIITKIYDNDLTYEVGVNGVSEIKETAQFHTENNDLYEVLDEEGNTIVYVGFLKNKYKVDLKQVKPYKREVEGQLSIFDI